MAWTDPFVRVLAHKSMRADLSEEHAVYLPVPIAADWENILATLAAIKVNTRHDKQLGAYGDDALLVGACLHVALHGATHVFLHSPAMAELPRRLSKHARVPVHVVWRRNWIGRVP